MAVTEGRRHEADLLIGDLCARYELSGAVEASLHRLLALVAADRLAPTAISDPVKVVNDHLADSLVALELEQVRGAEQLVDLGSGAGFPGLPLAIVLPEARFTLLESSGRRCAFIDRAVRQCGLANVEVVHRRAEAWDDGLGRFDLALARALAALDVVVEYAAPLLRRGGTLVAWRGSREPEAERAAERAADLLGMRSLEMRQVQPYSGARDRYLHLVSKLMETPEGFPRRPGMARKRPLGGGKA